MSERALTAATIAAFVVGVGLMVPFEGTVVRILGVGCLVAFIVLGVFAIARPERLGVEPPEAAPADERLGGAAAGD
jgi:hypothetical protein